MSSIPWTLSPDRCFAADPARRTVARELYASVKDLQLVSPHGHVPPALLADPEARFGSPAEDEAHEMAHECAYGVAKRAYRVPETTYVTR